MATVTPEPILKTALGFMAAKHLFAASEVGLFAALAAAPATLDELAQRTGVPRRTTRILADAMVSLGFLEKESGRYRNSAVAAALAEGYDFARHRHLLDLGGGTGNFLCPVLARHAGLSATLYELPDTVAVARRELAGKPEAVRIAIVAGDLFQDPLPEGADAVLIANLVHLFSPARTLEMLRRVRRQAVAGARLLLVDFWTDPSHTQPAPAALMAGEFLLFAGEGDVYSAEEAREWLRESGWRPLAHEPLAGPQSLIVAEAA